MLSDTQIRAAKASDKAIRPYDERGLYLEVTPAGGRWWRFKYRFEGKDRLLSMGTYPDTWSLLSSCSVRGEVQRPDCKAWSSSGGNSSNVR